MNDYERRRTAPEKRLHSTIGSQESARATVAKPGTGMALSDECRVLPHKLRRVCSVTHFRFDTTRELPDTREIIGQPRGVRAIEFGIDIDSPDHNVFLFGPTGTGRATAVRQFLERRAKKSETPHDWVYVYNFRLPNKPRALMLPAGTGPRLQEAMAELVEELQHRVPLLLDTEEYRQDVAELDRLLRQQQEETMGQLVDKAAQQQLTIVRSSTGLVVVAADNGQPLAPEAFAQLPAEQRQTIDAQRLKIQRELEAVTRHIHMAEKEARTTRRTLEVEAVTGTLELLLAGVRELCVCNQKAQLWLDELRRDILNHLALFKPVEREGQPATSAAETISSSRGESISSDPRLRRYQVNPIVHFVPGEGAPVVLEDLPTYKNLVGFIEAEVHAGGAMSADFTLIKPGALQRANGGYLVIRAADILKQPLAWEALKRALDSSVIRIEEPQSQNSAGALFPQRPAPEPIPLSVKVVLLGTPEVYYSLLNSDEEFPELFKVKASFATKMARTHANEDRYASFVAARCHESHLIHFDRFAVARIVEYGSRLAEDQGKLSTRFGTISDLVHEAAHWARSEGHKIVAASDVQRAIKERAYRANLVEEEERQRILDGTIFIDTEGEVIGQINGLSILSSGDHLFGHPCRVTARIYLGNEGVINIEREVDMAGPIHNKGLLTLRGYLGGLYALEHPLSLTASLSFEQNYGGIDGDSASTAELYALLSALSGYPIRQDLAVTGSANQLGQVQPVGGVNQKIEGFYELCRARGLTGTQGVIIPSGNVKSLMLREDVVRAVEAERFHIYAISTIDQGIEILTGMPAGQQRPDGSFPEGSVHYAVKSRLRELAERLQHYGRCSADMLTSRSIQ